jgi:hypothetical protein
MEPELLTLPDSSKTNIMSAGNADLQSILKKKTINRSSVN